MDEYVASLARAAGGAFTGADAHRWGLSDNERACWARCGLLNRARRGVYALPGPSRTPEEEHAERVKAILLTRQGPLAADRSTLALAHLPLVRVDLSTVMVRQAKAQLHGAGPRHPRRSG